MSEHCDRTWNSAQIEVEQSLDSLYARLKEGFHEWILQLNIERYQIIELNDILMKLVDG